MHSDSGRAAKYDGLIGDVVWLDWTHYGRELAALNRDGQIKRWPWAATQPINANSPRGDAHNDYAPAAPNAVPDRENNRGQAAAAENRHVARGEAHDERVVIDPQKLLLACVSDGALGVWDISAPTPMPVAATILPDDVWARSCAFAGASRLVFRTLGAGYRIYDYLLDKGQAGHRSTDQR